MVLGRIGRVHGVKGWLRLHSYTEAPESLLAHRRFQSGSRLLEMDEGRRQGQTLLAHFKGYDSPEAAAALTGLELAVAREALPALEAGDYYWHQLQGLRVVNQRGEDFGIVQRLLETGANDVLVVQPDSGSIDRRERLIPYLPGPVVTGVDLDAGRLTVDWEADYLA